MGILFALLLLLLVFVLVYGLVEEWDKIRGRVTALSLLGLVLLGGTFFLLRYFLTHSTGCTPDCAGMNLVGRNLRGLELNAVSFVEADLSSADLSQAQLVAADLSGATLLSIKLEGANLQDAFLLGADLAGANLAGANLVGANLSGANLTSANLTGVDLTQTVLKGAQLLNAQLVGVNLTGANLSAIQLRDANMNGARLVNANLSGAVLSGADLSGARLTNSNLSGAWLNLTNLIGADLSNSDLSGSSLIAANLASADLTESSLVGSNLVGADLKGGNLNAADLRGVTLDVASLPETIFQLDSKLAELNELQRGQLLVDARLDGAGFDSQTIWPNTAVAARFAGAQATVVETTTVTTETIKVGLLHSLSGPLAIGELPIRDAVLLAIDEINAAGGVLGLPLTPILEDGASDPALFRQKARNLIEDDEVVTLFGCWSSDCRKAVLPVVEELNNLLFYPTAYEGFESSPNIFYIGAEPSQQIIPAVDYLLSQGYNNILLVGSDYVFPRTVNAIIRAQLADADLQAAGEIYFPLDATDFGQFIAQLQAATPQVIFSTLIGESNINFFRQLTEAGFTAQSLPVLSASISEEEILSIGPEAVAGHLIASTYFQTTQTPENFAFVTAFKTAYGEERVTNSAVAAAYAAVYLWKALVEAAGSTATADIQQTATSSRIEYTAPEGLLRIDGRTHHVYKTARIGVVRDDGLIEVVFASEAPIRPDPFLTQFPWAEGLQEEIEGTNR